MLTVLIDSPLLFSFSFCLPSKNNEKMSSTKYPKSRLKQCGVVEALCFLSLLALECGFVWTCSPYLLSTYLCFFFFFKSQHIYVINISLSSLFSSLDYFFLHKRLNPPILPRAILDFSS